MTTTHSQFALLRRSLVGAMASILLAMVLAGSALAGYTVHYSYWDPDTGLGHHVVETDEGDWLYVITDEDYEVYYAEEIEESDNPDPENGTTTPGDDDSRIALLKQKGGTGYATPAWQDTPLGAYLDKRGVGIAPYHNPYGDEEGGLSPSSFELHDPSEDALFGDGHGSLGGSLLNPNGGPIREQLKINGRKKGTGDDPNDGSSGPQQHPLFDDFMVGPPELINPNPVRTARLAR